MTDFSHLDAQNQPTMVDVGDKRPTARTAWARGTVVLPPQILDLLQDGELSTRKGPVFQTAIIAGTMAAKKTSDLIPFCHPLPLESCKLQITLDDQQRVIIDCRVAVHHKTGVEMEALTGVQVAALTIYDMCKAISHDIRITDVHLVEKTGGKHDVHVQTDQ